jgi:integrase
VTHELFDEERGRDGLRWIREAEVKEEQEGPQRLHQPSLFGDPPFPEMAAWYVAQDLTTDRLAPGTRESRRSCLAQALAWLKTEGISHPETGDWVRYRNWRQSAQCPNQIASLTWDSHRKTLSLVYEFCRRVPKRGWGPIPNPLHFTRLPPDGERRKEPRCMARPEETFELLRRNMPDVRWQAFITLLFTLGPRLQEALGIPLPGSKVDGGRNLLDLERKQLTIWRQRDTDNSKLVDLKSGFSERVLSIPTDALEVIRETLQWKRHMDAHPTAEWKRHRGFLADNFLFPFWRYQLEEVMEIHRQLAPADFPEWERALKGGAAWHVYRHTMATLYGRTAMDLGVPNWQDDLHRLLGHADKRTTDAYLRALRLEVVKSDGMAQVWEAQRERRKQSIEERSGKGLQLVKPREEKRR